MTFSRILIFFIFIISCDNPSNSTNITGCIDDQACNYNQLANNDDGSCWYANTPCTCNDPIGSNDCDPLEVNGCTDPSACNFNQLANSDNGSCLYSIDCNGVCGGSAIIDDCGICGGDNSVCCPNDICISFSDIDTINNQMNLQIINKVEISGFQFELTGLVGLDTQAGEQMPSDWLVSNSESIILAFSFNGTIIDSGFGTLLKIIFQSIVGEVCIENAVFSDSFGNSYTNFSVDCFSP